MNLTSCYCDLTNSLKPYVSAIDFYNKFLIVSTKEDHTMSNTDIENNGVHAWLDETEHSLLNFKNT